MIFVLPARREAGRDRAVIGRRPFRRSPRVPLAQTDPLSPLVYSGFLSLLLKESGGARILKASPFTIHRETVDILYFHAAIPAKLRRACRQTRHIPLFGTPIRQPANVERRGARNESTSYLTRERRMAANLAEMSANPPGAPALRPFAARLSFRRREANRRRAGA